MFVALVSVRIYEPCLVVSVGHVLMVSLSTLAPTILPLPVLRGSAGSTSYLALGLFICSHQLLGDVYIHSSSSTHDDRVYATILSLICIAWFLQNC